MPEVLAGLLLAHGEAVTPTIDDTAYFESRRVLEIHRDLTQALEALFEAHGNAVGTHARGCRVDVARNRVAHALRLLDEELDRERAAGYRPNREG